MPDRFQYDVFLSHNHADKSQVRRLAERLKAAGVRVWLDEWVIQAGDIIALKVDEGLLQTRVLLLCISPAALASGWVTLEQYTAIHSDPANAGRRFIPLLLGDCALPDTLRRYKYVDYRDESEAAFADLLAVCSRAPVTGFESVKGSPTWLPTDVSPFYTAAMMPAEHPSYIPRISDNIFARLLQDRKAPCIAINGESEFGKSCLMNRAAQILGPAWIVVSVKLSDLRADKVDGCVDRFLMFFPRAFGELASLSQLVERVAEKPVLVLIDEFAAMATPGAKILLPDLMERVGEAGGNLRVVATLITGIEPILSERGVTSRRHHRLWKTVTVEPFEEHEAKRLLALLPDAARAVTERLFSEIQRRSELKPRRLQCLADRLWHAHREGADEARLAALVSRADSYD